MFEFMIVLWLIMAVSVWIHDKVTDTHRLSAADRERINRILDGPRSSQVEGAIGPDGFPVEMPEIRKYAFYDGLDGEFDGRFEGPTWD